MTMDESEKCFQLTERMKKIKDLSPEFYFAGSRVAHE